MFNLRHPRITSWPGAPVLGIGALLLAWAVIAHVADGAPAIGGAGDSVAAMASDGAAARVSDGAAARVSDGAAVVPALPAVGGMSGAAGRNARRPDAPAATAESPPSRRRCGGCGVVVAIRQVALDGASGADALSAALPSEFGGDGALAAPPRHTFIVHLEDGSERQIIDSNRLAWRIGERVMIIDGGQAGGR